MYARSLSPVLGGREVDVKAEIVRITAEGSYEARTENQLLLVFQCPGGRELRLGDVLIFDALVPDQEVAVRSSGGGDSFAVRISDIHDLRLPAGHGSSRQPSPSRLRNEEMAR
jgi:hypothetical protein